MHNNKSFIKLLKTIVCSLWNGNAILEAPNKVILDIKLEPERVQVLRKLVRLVMQTPYTDAYTKYYLSHMNCTYLQTAEIIKTKGEGEVNEASVRGHIWFKVQSLINLLGENSLTEILYYKTPDRSISDYATLIDSALLMALSPELNSFILPLEAKKITKSLDADIFETMLELIEPYSKYRVSLVERSLSEDMLGYLNYLVSQGELLTGIDLENYQKLKELF